MYNIAFFDLEKLKMNAKKANKEKNNFALKIIPELKSSFERLGISGSLIKINQIFEKKNAKDKPKKIKKLKINIYKYFLS